MPHTREYDNVEASHTLVRLLMRQSNAVFVFGSNDQGIHGAGAALYAKQHYGAQQGYGEGLMGRSYALPTKYTPSHTRPLDSIAGSVEHFRRCALAHPDLLFVVTRVGCGRAGYRDEQIAPLFHSMPGNVVLPLGWRTD